MDTYCWIHSTFSIPSRVAGEDGYDRAHAGVAPHSDLEDGQDVRYHKYYQWVCSKIQQTKTRTATEMDGTLHTDFQKSETSRYIKNIFNII